MDLDLWDCFGRKRTPSYNQRNTVHFVLQVTTAPTQRFSFPAHQRTTVQKTPLHRPHALSDIIVQAHTLTHATAQMQVRFVHFDTKI